MSKAGRQMKIGFSVAANGTHKGGWRHPTAWVGGLDAAGWRKVVQAAEAAKIHFIFWADGAAVRTEAPDIEALSYSGRIEMLEPLTLIAAMSQVSEHIGFVATGSTSFNEPYTIARKFASLDYLTGGRVGWNVVTSWSEAEAKNFNLDKHVDHAARYRRAEEFLDVVTGLWDSWEDAAFIRNKETGQYFDPKKLHILNHKGDHFSVRGPLNVARPIQGHPVIAQAGASEPGQELAARTADLVYTAQQQFEDAKKFYDSVKGRMAKYGRAHDELLIMPGLMPIIGRTDQEAKDKYAYLQDLLHPVAGLNSIAQLFGDLSKYPLDGPLPDVSTDTNASKSVHKLWIDRARRENMTIRQLYQAFSVGAAHMVVVGSPKTIADTMQEWFEGGACDGMTVMQAYMPGGIFDFAELVIPELQRRNIFRTEYEGKTLRENLGLSRPPNRFTQSAGASGRSEMRQIWPMKALSQSVLVEPASLRRAGETLSTKQREPSSLRDAAYEAIKRRIITCAFRPGEYLNEAAVSAMIGIGRTPVHQAIDRLMLEGMVEVMPRKGVIVKPVSLQEIIQIVEVRLLNECYCARLAAERADGDEIGHLADVLTRSKEWMVARNNEQLMLLDREFHWALAKASKNQILRDWLSKLHDRSLRFWFISLDTPGHHASVQSQHQAILDGIRDHDPVATEDAMRMHIEAFRANIMRHL